MEIICDFKKDFCVFCKNILSSLGVKIDNLLDDEIEMLFWRVWYRIPSPKKRSILRAKTFLCPNELQDALTELEQRVTNGDTLYPFLSKRIKDVNKNSFFFDDLLSDWGIHHFHLGKCTCDGFSERTNNLLFAIVGENEFYEIAIMPHGQWNNTQLLEIIFNNWPNLLKSSIIPIFFIPKTDKEILRKLRKKHIMTPVSMASGDCLLSPGGGYATDGTPTIVVENHDRMVQIIRNLEKKVNDGFFCNLIKKSQCISDKISIHLEFSLEKPFNPTICIAPIPDAD